MAQIKLLNIYWKQNSPFGTYVTGDSIDVYWDTDTDGYYVTKTGVTVTSGPDVPPTFTYNGQDQDYYVTRTLFQASICDGTTLLTFQFYPLFPYLFKYQYTDHPTCVIPTDTPVVCDLDFDALPLVTGISAAGAFDGQIIVSASGSNGSVQYRLNSDFSYNDGTAQTSGTFTGLGQGTYLVYARDAKNCLSVQSVTVGVANSYGVKYRLTYYDTRYPQTAKAHHKTEILEKDYTGQVYNVNGGASPTVLSVRAEGEKDKFVPILPTEMIMTLLTQSNRQYSDLYTNDPEKYRMRHSIDTGSGYSVVWTGKVLPNQYESSYNSRVDEVKIVATDGLALLQSEYFVDDDNNRLNGDLKAIQVIAWILKKIGLGLSIRSACNIYATGMTTTAASDPLDQSYIDVSRYYLITELPNCWDVLRYILEPFGAQIVLYNNVWNIIRVEERTRSFDYREFDSDGVYVSNGTYDPIKDIKQSGDGNRLVWADGNQLFKNNPGFGKIRLLYNLGLKKNLLVNGDFAVKKYSIYQANVGGGSSLVKGTIPDLTGFQLVNNGTNPTTSTEDLGDGNIAIVFDVTEVGAYLQSEAINLKLGGTDSIKFTINLKINNYVVGFNNPKYYFYNKVKIKVTYGDYYLLDGGQWTIQESFITMYIKSEDNFQFKKLEIIADSPEDSYINGQEIHVQVYPSFGNDYEYGSLTALAVTPVATLPEDYKTEALDGVTIYYYQLKNTTEAESLPDIVTPSDYNVTTNPYKWVKVGTGALNVTNTLHTVTAIDSIQIEALNKRVSLPEVASYEQAMENENKLNLDKVIYHGGVIQNGTSTKIIKFSGKTPDQYQGYTIPGLFEIQFNYDYLYFNSPVDYVYTANSADLSYSGYLRNATGGGYTTWFRDAVSELRPLENIFMDMNSSQYNAPWGSIHGSFIGDILYSPIDSIRETMDNNRIYYPVYLEIDYRANSYNAQFLELTDVIAASGSGAEFDFDFDLSYNS